MAYPTLAVTKEGANVVRVTPITLNVSGSFASFGTYRDFIAIADPGFEIKNSESAQEFYERRLSGGVTAKIGKSNSYVDPVTGEPTAAASEGGDTFKFTFLITYDDIKYFMNLMRNSVPVVISFPPILDSTGEGIPGWAHMVCKFQGNFAMDGKEGIAEVSVTFQGGVGYDVDAADVDYADFNTAATGALHKITPLGWDSTDALTIAALATGDNATFFSGAIVLKDV
jgi:hypothetical protein